MGEAPQHKKQKLDLVEAGDNEEANEEAKVNDGDTKLGNDSEVAEEDSAVLFDSPVFFLVAAARGVLPKDKPNEEPVNHATLLRRLGEVVGPAIEGPTFISGAAGASPKKLEALQEHLAKVAIQFPGRGIVMVGHSFGCRLITHYLCGQSQHNKSESGLQPFSRAALPPFVLGAICCGYPMIAASEVKTEQRKSVILALQNNEDTNILFLSGEKDKLTGNLADVVATSPAADNLQVHFVPGGKHNVFETPKKNRAQATKELLGVIKTWVHKRQAAVTARKNE